MAKTIARVTTNNSWKVKVRARLNKEMLFFKNYLKADFPLSEPVHLISAETCKNWGSENKDLKKKQKAIISSDIHEFNHFEAYYQAQNNHRYSYHGGNSMNGKFLRNLAIQIAHSLILHPDTRLSRFSEILGMYLKEKYLPDIDLLKAYASVITLRISDLKGYHDFLSKFQTQFPSANSETVLPEIIEGICANGNINLAKKIFLGSKSNECFSVIIETLISKNMIMDAFELSVQVCRNRREFSLNPWTAQLLLNSFLRLSQKEDVENVSKMVVWIFERINAHCWSFGMITTLYQLAEKNVEFKTALGPKLYEEIITNKYDQSHIVWKAKIDNHLRARRIDKAYEMQAKAFYPDHLVFNQLIIQMASEALLSTKEMEDKKRKGQLMAKIFVLYKKLAESKLHINLDTFEILLKLFASTGNHRRCRSFIWAMHRRSIPVTAKHYYYYIDAYCRTGSVILARSAIEEMLRWKIQPSLSIYSRMIEGFLVQNPPNFDKAFAYLKNMRNMKVNADDRLIRAFITALSKLAPIDNFELSQIWAKILSSMMPTNIVVFKHLMVAAFNCGELDYVNEYYRLLCLSGLSPDREANLILLKSNLTPGACQE